MTPGGKNPPSTILKNLFYVYKDTLDECLKYCRAVSITITGCEYNIEVRNCAYHQVPLDLDATSGHSAWRCYVFREGKFSE